MQKEYYLIFSANLRMYKTLKNRELVLLEIKRKIYSLFINSGGGYFTGGYILPKFVSIFLTFKCNLSCKYCIHKDNSLEYKKNFRDIDKEITTEKWKKILKDVFRFAKIIDVTGAEPFLYNDWEKITKFIKDNNCWVHLQTNGVEINKYLEEILTTVDRIQVSLDGIEKINDRIRGEGVYQKVMQGLMNLDKLKKTKGQTTPLIDINFTIQNENVNYISQFCDYFNKSSIDIKNIIFKHPFYSDNPIDYNFEKISNLIGNYSSFRRMYFPQNEKINKNILIEEMKKVKNKKYKFNISFFPELTYEEINEFYEDNKLTKTKRCTYPWRSVFILSNGDVGICSNFFIGNAINENISKLFRSEKTKSFRRYLWDKKEFSFCSSCDNLFVS